MPAALIRFAYMTCSGRGAPRSAAVLSVSVGEWTRARKKVVLTGNKAQTQTYSRYSGYPGGLYEHSLDRLKQRRPHDIVKLAVRRMLPKSRLGKSMLSRLKVYSGDEHPHTAQQPVKVETL